MGAYQEIFHKIIPLGPEFNDRICKLHLAYETLTGSLGINNELWGQITRDYVQKTPCCAYLGANRLGLKYPPLALKASTNAHIKRSEIRGTRANSKHIGLKRSNGPRLTKSQACVSCKQTNAIRSAWIICSSAVSRSTVP